MKPRRTAPLSKIVSLQYLRAFGALLVVLHHVRNPAPWLWNPLDGTEFGNAGVMVFFVLSGFVMHASCRGGSVVSFVWRRFVRIVPFYWLMTTAAFVFLDLHVLASDPSGAEWLHYAKSLSFVPHFSPRHPESIYPVLLPGWTLNFEVFFFALFAAGMVFGRPSSLAALSILVLVTTGFLAHPSSAAGITYTSHLLILFAVGIGIGWMYERFDFSRLKCLLPFALAGLTLAAFKVTGDDHHFLFFVSSALLVVGALAWEVVLRNRPSPLAVLTGDASYSIYLTHPFVYPPMLAVLRHVPLSGPTQFLFVSGVTMTVCAFAGIAKHIFVEKRLIGILRNLPEALRNSAWASKRRFPGASAEANRPR
jgi:exopolysaccharide production protein ExoZ